MNNFSVKKCYCFGYNNAFHEHDTPYLRHIVYTDTVYNMKCVDTVSYIIRHPNYVR